MYHRAAAQRNQNRAGGRPNVCECAEKLELECASFRAAQVRAIGTQHKTPDVQQSALVISSQLHWNQRVNVLNNLVLPGKITPSSAAQMAAQEHAVVGSTALDSAPQESQHLRHHSRSKHNSDPFFNLANSAVKLPDGPSASSDDGAASGSQSGSLWVDVRKQHSQSHFEANNSC